jgi:UDP-N-acetylmuramoyl-L-alanyl-D-glutamate--2,6-diaminopimelate ligase
MNIDDAAGRELAAGIATTGARLVTFGLDPSAAITAENVVYDTGATSFRLVDRDAGRAVDVRTPLLGPFNVSNALAAAATAHAAGFELDAIAAGLAAPASVPGRMEAVERGQPFAVFVDYAHTPAALTAALTAARALGDGRVLAVFGAGGDRDRAKRPLMGEAVGRAADVAVLTSDNPRTEDPAAIARQVATGFAGTSAEVVIELDRRAAIHAALAAARAADVVVIAGKGHEQGQEFEGGRKIPFDDVTVAREALVGPSTSTTAR